MQVIKSYASAECNTFDVVVNGQTVAYYYEHFAHPETGEKLEAPVFEIYYEFDGEEYVASLLSEDFEDIEEVLADIQLAL